MDREKLFRAGIDYDGGVHRFAGNPGVYEKFLAKFLASSELPALRAALEAGKYDAAFRLAHNLKGSSGNLSVTAFYDKICQLVEALRSDVRDGSLLALCAQAEALYLAAQKAAKE